MLTGARPMGTARARKREIGGRRGAEEERGMGGAEVVAK